MPTLSQGARGPAVELAQAALNFHANINEATLEVDGDFGSRTKARVIEFQRTAGLSDDGIIGPATEAVLFASVDVVAAMRVVEKKLDLRRPTLRFNSNGPLLPPLTLPGLGGGFGPTPLLPVPKLALSMPVGPGQATNLPGRPGPGPSGEAIDIFTIKVKLLKDVRLKLNGELEASNDLDGSSKLEATSKATVGVFDSRFLTIDIFAKAKAEMDPSKPGDTSIKGGGGLKFTIRAGRVVVETSLGADVFKVNPASGEAKAGLIWIGGTVDLIRF
ncbi:MAG: peptidoglycan-binding domain-containing protein [Paracoccaceae bacterium]